MEALKMKLIGENSDKYNIKSNISYSQMKAEPFY